MNWRKAGAVVGVRDSQDPGGPALGVRTTEPMGGQS
jgi:hypothetical protein